ncbi:MAG: DUF4292 domain-containing protein [Flavobacteriia bacterium]|nr:DUF4292 domain-containing protein [Flavobacteriia bacterium]
MIRFISLLFIGLVLFLFSCSKKILGENLTKIDRKKTHELVNALDSMYVKQPSSFYTKISTKYKDTSMQISFKTSVRVKNDSATSALITYLGLPIYQSIVTKDSLTIVDKRSKCYIKTKLHFIKENFGVNFDYKNIEELLLGLPIGYDINQKYFQIHNPYQYIVSSHRKREIKKSDKKEKMQDDIIIKYYLNSDLQTLQKTEIESKEDSTSIVIHYLNRQNIENINVPEEVKIEIIAPRNTILVEMNYDKVEINQIQEFILNIPEKYGECK